MDIKRENHDDHETDDPAHKDGEAHEAVYTLAGVVLQQEDREGKCQNPLDYRQNELVHFI